MKFDFCEKKEERGCVAFIRGKQLIIKERDGGNLVLSEKRGCYKGDVSWEAMLTSVGIQQKFYKGDSITITF